MLIRCADCHYACEEADWVTPACPKCDGLNLLSIVRDGEPVKPYKLSENDRRFLTALHIANEGR